MSNKQGQPGPIGNKKQEGQGNQGFQEGAKDGAAQKQQGQDKQVQPGSQKDKNGKIGQ